mgnify:CR=1 FL=1
MGSIIFLSAEILLIGAGIYFASFFTVCMITIFSLAMLWFWFEKKEFLYYIIPLVFLIRIFTTVNFHEISSGEILKAETNIVNGRGKALKIDDRFPLKNINLFQILLTADILYTEKQKNFLTNMNFILLSR